jgi:hypothetical protein
LENEWSQYIENFQRLDMEKQKDFLSKQGVDSFHDMLAHIIGWWEESARIISGILDSPGFIWTDPEVDEFNRMLKKKFAAWSDEDMLKHFELVRLAFCRRMRSSIRISKAGLRPILSVTLMTTASLPSTEISFDRL